MEDGDAVFLTSSPEKQSSGPSGFPRSFFASLLLSPTHTNTHTQQTSFPALTGDTEPAGTFCGHLRSSEFYPAGEIGVVVLGPWGESEHRGIQAPRVFELQGIPQPGEGEGLPPLAGSWQAAAQVSGTAGLQRLRNVQNRFLCEG